MTEGHSPLGASSAERWLNCPGSVSLLKGLGLPTTDEPGYRREGTVAHHFAAKCLMEGFDGWEVAGEKLDEDVCSPEMAEHIQLYLDTCRARIVPHGIVRVEQHLSSPKHALMYGTVDFASVADSLLNIVDFKYGEGVTVDVEENPQLMYYAYLVLQDYPDVRRVVLRIVQPRGFHPDGPVRRWETTGEAICEWVERTLVPGMLRAELDHSLDAGPWCRFCPAKLVCPLMTSLFGAAATSNPKSVVTLDDRSLGRSYQYTFAAECYIRALKEECFRRMMQGKNVPGTKLVHKKANRVWKGGAEAVFREQFGDKAVWPTTLKSPAEMEKVNTDAKALVKEFAYTPESGLTLALESDKRSAVPVRTAEQVFGHVALDGVDVCS